MNRLTCTASLLAFSAVFASATATSAQSGERIPITLEDGRVIEVAPPPARAEPGAPAAGEAADTSEMLSDEERWPWVGPDVHLVASSGMLFERYEGRYAEARYRGFTVAGALSFRVPRRRLTLGFDARSQRFRSTFLHDDYVRYGAAAERYRRSTGHATLAFDVRRISMRIGVGVAHISANYGSSRARQTFPSATARVSILVHGDAALIVDAATFGDTAYGHTFSVGPGFITPRVEGRIGLALVANLVPTYGNVPGDTGFAPTVSNFNDVMAWPGIGGLAEIIIHSERGHGAAVGAVVNQQTIYVHVRAGTPRIRAR